MKIYIILSLGIYCLSLSAMEDSPTEQEYAFFKLVKKVRAIAAESRQQIKEKFNACDERPLAKNPPIPAIKEPDLEKTTEPGLFVVVEDFPMYLDMQPWGSIEIRTTAQSYQANYLANVAACQLFFNRVKAHLVGYGHFFAPKGYYEVVNQVIVPTSPRYFMENDKETYKKISSWEMNSYVGKSNLIVSTKCGEITRYKITEVESEPVPNIESIPQRSPEMAEKIWKTMEERYAREQLAKH